LNSSSISAEWKAFFCEVAPVWSTHYTEKKNKHSILPDKEEPREGRQNEINTNSEKIIQGMLSWKILFHFCLKQG
jgi:hypothetical protein